MPIEAEQLGTYTSSSPAAATSKRDGNGVTNRIKDSNYTIGDKADSKGETKVNDYEDLDCPTFEFAELCDTVDKNL